jgi:hypothetical protein
MELGLGMIRCQWKGSDMNTVDAAAVEAAAKLNSSSKMNRKER